jgi:hypothetical protein
MNLKAIREKIWLPRNDWDAPSKGLLCNWVREGGETSHESVPLIDMHRYSELLTVLPDHIVENLEKARLARLGRYPMIKAGLGAVDLLTAIIVDATAVGTSNVEAKIGPTLVFGKNYMQPSGVPGKTIRVSARGRETTLTTQATMTFRFRIANTDVITGTAIMASGGITQDAVAQTNSMWEVCGDFTVRSVGSTGTVNAMGRAEMAAATPNIGNQQAQFMGSSGATSPSPATWDMNSDQYFQFTGQWSLSTAYSIQLHNYILEALN